MFRKLLRLSTKLAVCGFGFALILGWFAPLHPAFDSFSTFRLVFACGMICALLLAIILRENIFTISGLMILLASLILTFPHIPGLKRGYAVPNIVASQPKLKVLQANITFANTQINKIANAIKKFDADVILLQEVSGLNEAALKLLDETHPYQLNCRSRFYHSVAMLSRLPFVDGAQNFCREEIRFGQISVVFQDMPVTLASFHAFWPWPKRQYLQIDALTSHWSERSQPTIFAGDFNASPWSYAVKRIANITKTQVPSGLKFTWRPGDGKNGLPEVALLSLDHALHSKEFGLLSRKIMPSLGSDHLPVLSTYILLEPLQ